MIDLRNPTTQYILADLFGRLVDAYVNAQVERARRHAEVRRRLFDLAVGTALGAMGMAFALLTAGVFL